MTPGNPATPLPPQETGASAGRPRDAGNTRLLLLRSARRRFAIDGYAATTVRDIAADAGVNVALINRYFSSKEGLFEACLQRAVEELDRPQAREESVEQVLRDIVSQVTETPSGEYHLQLLLLLRSSGDEGADRIRRNTLHYFTERIAAAAGWRPDDPATDELLLRAQIALSTAFGIVLLRSSAALQPLSSATEQELGGPLSEVLRVLLSPTA